MGDLEMPKATMASTSAATSKSRQRRRKQVNYPYQTPLRYGVAERDAVDATRVAVAAVRGVAVDEVKFSEAARLLILDKAGAAEIEAKAAVLKESGKLSMPAELTKEDREMFAEFQRALAHCQGALSSLAKSENYRRAGFGEGPVLDDVMAALEEVHWLRDWVDGHEHRVVFGQ
ncbi:hypothetical protein [Agrococcus casei]|uniref:hypothetical protein n=1 Tax=Agrococcus casei TaxID=343512 RepID=UPI003F9005D2